MVKDLIDAGCVETVSGGAAAAGAEGLGYVGRDDADALKQSQVASQGADGGVYRFANVAVVAVRVGGEVADDRARTDAREDCGGVSRYGGCWHLPTVSRRGAPI